MLCTYSYQLSSATSTWVTMDNSTLGDLVCGDSPTSYEPMTCQVTILRFDSGTCYEWDMGDGSPLVYYRDGSCSGTVPGHSPIYVEVR